MSYAASSFTALVRATLARAEAVNAFMQSVKDSFLSLPDASKIIAGTVTYAADTGAANAYVVTLSPAPSAYSEGQTVDFKAANANTGASTINVNGLGVKSIRGFDGSELVAGQVPTGSIVTVRYDGTVFRINNIVGVSVPADGSVTAPKFAAGAVGTTALADGSVTEAKLGSALSAALPRIGTDNGQVRTNSDLDLRYPQIGTDNGQVRVNSDLDARYPQIGTSSGQVRTNSDLDLRYAQLAVANTFTGLQTISSASPEIRFVETDRTAVNYVPALVATSNSFRVQLRGVAGGAVDNNAYIINYTSAGAAVEHFFGLGTSTVARIDESGTAASFTTTIITREKGQALFAPIASGAMFKTDIAAASAIPDLSSLGLKTWLWGGEIPADDFRYGQPGMGLLADDVATVAPLAARFDEFGRPAGIDPLTLLAIHIVRTESRLAALEAA